MEFDIEGYCSSALNEILSDKGLLDKSSFSLPIKMRPAFQYLDYLEKRYGLEFVREFHVGCSADDRPPNIRYTAERKDWKGVMYLSCEQWLTYEAFSRNRYFHDANGLRDLEAVSKAMNNKKNIEERVLVGWSGSEKALGTSPFPCERRGNFEIHIDRNTWEHVDGIDNFFEETYGKGQKRKAILGRMVEGTDSPFARPEVRKAVKNRQVMYAKEFSAATGMLLADAVGEAVKIFWPQLREEPADDKVLRDQLFGGVRTYRAV